MSRRPGQGYGVCGTPEARVHGVSWEDGSEAERMLGVSQRDYAADAADAQGGRAHSARRSGDVEARARQRIQSRPAVLCPVPYGAVLLRHLPHNDGSGQSHARMEEKDARDRSRMEPEFVRSVPRREHVHEVPPQHGTRVAPSKLGRSHKQPLHIVPLPADQDGVHGVP